VQVLILHAVDKPLMYQRRGGKVGAAALDAHSVETIIKRRVTEHYVLLGSPVKKAEQEATRNSGHSLRVGLAVRRPNTAPAAMRSRL
jgi:hypothetical protein